MKMKIPIMITTAKNIFTIRYLIFPIKALIIFFKNPIC